MDAAADYAAAKRMLETPLPAYVSYVERSYASAGDLTKDTSQTIVVRTQDGVVVKGDPQKVKISTDKDVQINPVSHPPFNPACYAAGAARKEQWDGHGVEAITIHDVCKKQFDTEADFAKLYVDPETHQPLAAVGGEVDDNVTVTVEQRLTRFGDHLMPTTLRIHVQGHGIVGFLNLSAGQDYTDYHFTDTMP